MRNPPTSIRALQEAGRLEISWEDGAVCRLPYRFLRGRCPCAGCVNEFTGVRIVDVDSVPEDVRPVQMGFSGNYALKISWSDGHSTGLYTWDALHALCQAGPAQTVGPPGAD